MQKRGFTLTKPLMVIAMIGILVVSILVSLASARAEARQADVIKEGIVAWHGTGIVVKSVVW